MWKTNGSPKIMCKWWVKPTSFHVSYKIFSTGWWFGISLEHFFEHFFHSVGNFIIPTDEVIFVRGVCFFFQQPDMLVYKILLQYNVYIYNMGK